jgi:aryl-alcohol dehydrogenase-like predicted oxidoreductase
MIDKQPFGRTGHMSSRTLLGAAAFGKVTQDEADATLELALGHGVNHIDTAASYGDSELRIGSWIQRHGKSFFLATKTAERSAGAAHDEIRRSLERLAVDQVDLLQLHNLVEPDAWQTALGPGGALEAAIAAKEEGLVRFIGVTGHGLAAPGQHRRALERFDFDSVLCPFSYLMSQNAQYWADVEALLEVCARRHVAVQTIKAIVKAPWGAQAQTGPTWYEPLREQTEIDLAVHWVLARRQVFLNTVGDVALIPKVLDAAERFGAAPAPAAMAGQLERMKMSNLFVTGWV